MTEIYVHFHRPGGWTETQIFFVDLNKTVEDLKSEINGRLPDFAINAQILYLGPALLRDESTLADSRVTEKSTLELRYKRGYAPSSIQTPDKESPQEWNPKRQRAIDSIVSAINQCTSELNMAVYHLGEPFVGKGVTPSVWKEVNQVVEPGVFENNFAVYNTQRIFPYALSEDKKKIGLKNKRENETEYHNIEMKLLLRQAPKHLYSLSESTHQKYHLEVKSTETSDCIVTRFSHYDSFLVVETDIANYLNQITQDIQKLNTNLNELSQTRSKILDALDKSLQRPLLPGDLSTKEGPSERDVTIRLPTAEYLLEAKRVNDAEIEKAQGMQYRLAKERKIYEWRQQQIDTRRRLWIMRDRLLGVLSQIHLSVDLPDEEGLSDPGLRITGFKGVNAYPPLAPVEKHQGKMTPRSNKRPATSYPDDSTPSKFNRTEIPVMTFVSPAPKVVTTVALNEVLRKTPDGDIHWLLPAPRVILNNENIKVDTLAYASVPHDITFPKDWMLPVEISSKIPEPEHVLLLEDSHYPRTLCALAILDTKSEVDYCINYLKSLEDAWGVDVQKKKRWHAIFIAHTTK